MKPKTRKCRICKKVKLLKEFASNKNCKSGKDSICNQCNRERLHDWYYNKGGKQKKREYRWFNVGTTTKEEIDRIKQFRENFDKNKKKLGKSNKERK